MVVWADEVPVKRADLREALALIPDDAALLSDAVQRLKDALDPHRPVDRGWEP